MLGNRCTGGGRGAITKAERHCKTGAGNEQIVVEVRSKDIKAGAVSEREVDRPVGGIKQRSIQRACCACDPIAIVGNSVPNSAIGASS